LRQSEAGAYTAILALNGELALYRGDQVIGTAVLPALEVGSWHTIRLSAINNIVRVSIDGNEVIGTQDSIPLPPGSFSIAGIGNTNSTLLVDDVSLSIPSGELQMTATPLPTVTIEFTATPSGPISYRPSNRIAAIATKLDPTRLVTDNTDQLIEGIKTANQNCSGGKNYVITLRDPGPYNISAPFPDTTGFDFGANGLPVIRCDITIQGNGHTIQRSSSSLFRILGVASNGILTLDHVSIVGGNASSTGGSGILNVGGTVIITNGSAISGNSLALNSGLQILGAGVYSYNGTLEITRSTISNNTNNSISGDGGGIAIINTVFSMHNTRITNNVASRNGGGIMIISSANSNITQIDIRSNSASNAGTAIYVDSSSQGISLTYSCIVNNPTTSFYSYNVLSIATDNWWGSGNGPDTGATNGASFVNSSNYKLTEPSDCTGLALSNYGTYAIFPDSTNSTDQNKLTGIIQNSLAYTSGVLTHKFRPLLEDYPFEADPTAFKQIMLGDDQNQIGFVFADLSNIAIPPNENWPSGYDPASSNSTLRVNPLSYERPCPFFISLSPGNSSGSTADNWIVSNPKEFPGGTGTIKQLIDNKGKGGLTHQALIVCDISKSLTSFSEYTAIYNFGLIYLRENGGLIADSTTYYGAFDNSYQGRTISDSFGVPIMGILDPSQNPTCIGDGENNVPQQIAINLHLNCIEGKPPASDWVRGQRGWGSGAPANNVLFITGVQNDIIRSACGFQENPIEAYPWRSQGMNKWSTTLQVIEYETTAADMFLNWIYYVYHSGSSGFWDIDWNGSQSCSNDQALNDSSNPGIARFNWVDNILLNRKSFMRN